MKDYDTNQSLEWRSDSRMKDIQKAHNELHRVTHAATLKDLLETISDIREDIEKTKKDKRTLVKNLARVDKLQKGRGRQDGTAIPGGWSTRKIFEMRKKIVLCGNTVY